MDKKITTKEDIEKHTYNGLLEVLNQGIIYKYVDFHIGINDILMPDGLKIKFDNPETFNDPFDCHEGLINFNKTENEDVKEYLEIQNQVLDRKNRRFVTRQTNKKKNMIKFFKEKKDLYKVSCFSKNYNNPLMWAHYANKHKGICIGYSFPILPEDFRVYNVTYRKNILPIDINIDENRVMYYWLTNKAMSWEYEEEIRAITKSSYPDNIIAVDKSWCKELIFGCNVKNKDLNNAIKKIKKSGYKKITIKQMVLNHNDFSLKEVSIPNIQNYKSPVK